MTGVAIQEVRDQLGIRGNSYARASVIKELTTNLKTCLGPTEYNAFFNLHKDKTINQIKEIYKSNIKYRIFAGARENYRLALEDYNGESTKVQYADNIIQKGIKIRELIKYGKL
jgi:D-Tyr-tRNAtyr deacylase